MRKLAYLLFLLMLGAEPAVDEKDLPRFPPVEIADAVKTFQVKEGFKIQLAAAEPLVVDPVAMAFDEDGHLFVVEMRDYSERREEKLGRIRMLTDTDGDGIFDKSTIYVDGLPWPTAVICWNGGVFVGATPDLLYFKDKDGDGIADEKKVLFTGFGSTTQRLNVQQLLNSFTWGLDNRIHGASGGNGGLIAGQINVNGIDVRGKDFSFSPRSLDFRPESGGAQHGLSFDDTFRKFVCSNSHHIQSIMYDLRYSARNSNYAMLPALIDIATDGPAAEVYRISPEEPWRVIRTKWRVSGLVPGPIEGGGRSAGYFTGATGVTIFRGDAWGPDYIGDAFIGDAGGNLVHRKKITASGTSLSASRPPDEQKREFLASQDTWFRPVQFANGPDGNLYICDMYREVIEHPWSLPESIKKHLDLNSGNDRGRIYRIVKDGAKYRPRLQMSKMTGAELVKLLESPNGWTRDTAARLIYERQDATAIEPLQKLTKESKSALGRMHALYALDGLGALRANTLADSIEDKDPIVRRHAVRLCESFAANPQVVSVILPGLVRLVEDRDILVRYQLAFTLGEFNKPERAEILAQLAEQNAADKWITAAIFSSIGDGALEICQSLMRLDRFKSSPEGRKLLQQLVALVAGKNNHEDVRQLLKDMTEISDKALLFALARGFNEAALAGSHAASSPELQRIFQIAIAEALNTRLAESTRLQAIDLLGFAADGDSLNALFKLLNAGPEVRSAALMALDRRNPPQLKQVLVENFKDRSPRARAEILNVMLKRDDRCEVLLKNIQDRQIEPAEFSAAQIQYLREHPNKAIATSAKMLFTQRALPRQEVINLMMPAVELKGDAKAGKTIFVNRCSSCHRLNNEGFPLGPDLVTVKNSGKEKLLVNILDPNREVASQYSSYLVQTEDGDSLLGIIVNDTASSITLRQAYGTETVVFRTKIKKLKNQGQSLMPEGLEEGLKPQDLADLLEFISK
jgi:putative membrane-bound dehydrogenase-like protein